MRLCQCGCGGELAPVHGRGRPRQWLPGHRKLTGEERDASRPKDDVEIPCACGCGEIVVQVPGRGRRRLWLEGHRASARASTSGALACRHVFKNHCGCDEDRGPGRERDQD